MDHDKQDDIIIKLNQLLRQEINLHAISFEFDKLAQEIRILGLSFRIVPTLEYYLDEELTFLHHREKKLVVEGNLPLAIETKEKKLQLLKLKEQLESTTLNSEQSVFKYESGIIIAHLNKAFIAQRLLANLIDGYNLRSRK